MSRTSRPWTRLASLSAVAVALFCATSSAAGGSSPDAQGSPERAECMRAHVATQQLRIDGKLVEAAKQVRICTNASCPGPIVADCGTWMGELEQATPSIVFEIEIDGHAVTEAKVSVDSVPVADWSKAVDVDPGTHSIRVEVPSFPAHEEQVQMAQVHRMRLVSVQFASLKAGTPPGDATPRPVPVVVYPLFGVGLAGLAGFGVFAGLGRAKQTDLEHGCEPHCTRHDLAPMKTDYLVGDISLGVGVAALIGSAVGFFVRPTAKPATLPQVTLGVAPVGTDSHGRTFWEASAAMRW